MNTYNFMPSPNEEVMECELNSDKPHSPTSVGDSDKSYGPTTVGDPSSGKPNNPTTVGALYSDKQHSPTIVGDEEDLMDNVSIQSLDTDVGEGLSGWQATKSKKSKKKVKKNIVVATRTSSRVPRDGVPIAEKAAQRVKAWNEPVGISCSSQNLFTVLNNAPTPELCAVIQDLRIEGDEIVEQVNIFRVEELARAAITEANYKQFLEKLKERDKLSEEELQEDMAMETISNLQRGFVNGSPKGGGLVDSSKEIPESPTHIIIQ